MHLFKIKNIEEDDSYKLLPLDSKCDKTQYDSSEKVITDNIVHCCTIKVIFKTLRKYPTMIQLQKSWQYTLECTFAFVLHSPKLTS